MREAVNFIPLRTASDVLSAALIRKVESSSIELEASVITPILAVTDSPNTYVQTSL